MSEPADLVALIFIFAAFTGGIVILALAPRRGSRPSDAISAAERSLDPVEQAERYLARGWPAQALATLEQAIERDPLREDVRRTLARLDRSTSAASAD